MTEQHTPEIGSLRSEIEVELHTYHGLQRWEGRRHSDRKLNIISFPRVVILINQMHYRAGLDDPYADWALIKVEQSIARANKRLELISHEVDEIFKKVPKQISVSDNLNQKPAKLILKSSSPLGYLSTFLLTTYDELVRKIVLAKHIGLLNSTKGNRYTNYASSVIRSFIGGVSVYKNAGVSRDDVAANNARAIQAKENFGLPPKSILEGTKRSQYAPDINVPKRLDALDQPKEIQKKDKQEENGAAVTTGDSNK